MPTGWGGAVGLDVGTIGLRRRCSKPCNPSNSLAFLALRPAD